MTYKHLPEERNEDGTLKHVVCEGARYHVLHWDGLGTHCSEPECEINKWTHDYNVAHGLVEN